MQSKDNKYNVSMEVDKSRQARSYLPIILAGLPLVVGCMLTIINPGGMMEFIKRENTPCGGVAILAILILSGLAYWITSIGSILINRNHNWAGRILLKTGLVILVLLFFVSPAIWLLLTFPAAIRVMNSGLQGL